MLRDKFLRFMYGRNGIDGLNIFILSLYVLVGAVNFIFRNFYVYIVIWIIFFIFLFRFLSKNLYRRQSENRKFTEIFLKIKPRIDYFLMIVKERNNYRFRKCKSCKSIMRLPIKRGKHTVKCQHCGKEFSVHIF